MSMAGMPLYSVDTEQALIGAVMIDNEAMTRVGPMVQPEDFSEPSLRAIWSAIVNLTARGEPCDAVTVSERLEATGQLADVGGMGALAEMAHHTPSARNASAYAGVVADLAQRRALKDRLVNLEDALHDRDTPLADLLGQAKGGMDSVLRDAGGDSLAPVKDLLGGIIDTIDRRFNGHEQAMGRTTGLTDLDKRMMGLCPGLHILGARPSMGKTAALINMACADLSSPTLIGSWEMPAERLIQRAMACLGNMPLKAILDPKGYMDAFWPSLTVAVNALKDAPLYPVKKGGMTVEELRRHAHEIADRHGHIGMIGVDYLQKIPARKDYGTRHDRAIGEVAEDLKELGDEMGCPVVALSQLNRALEQRPNKRPIMSDLKESSVLEQEAETITFLYRDEVYNPDNPDNQGLAEFIAAKVREGEIGTTHAVSRLDRGRFEDLAHTPMMASAGEWS